MKNKIITILILILCAFICLSNMRLEKENAKQKEYIKELEREKENVRQSSKHRNINYKS